MRDKVPEEIATLHVKPRLELRTEVGVARGIEVDGGTGTVPGPCERAQIQAHVVAFAVAKFLRPDRTREAPADDAGAVAERKSDVRIGLRYVVSGEQQAPLL